MRRPLDHRCSGGVSSRPLCIKLVADALEEDRRATCQEISRATGAITLQENTQEPTSFARGWATLST